jgi:hypothetical protein
LPIGQGHLESAEAEGLTIVVFGTNAWELMRRFASDHGAGSPVLFYESWGPRLPQASWSARFAEYVESDSGYPPRAWLQYREPIAAEEDEESAFGPGYFSGYYRVEDLARLAEPVPFSAIRTYPAARTLQGGFVPHGPIVVSW